MVDQRLVNYIIDNLKKGYSIDSIRESLLKEKWTINVVNEAIEYVQNQSQPRTKKEQNSKSLTTTIIIISALLLIVSLISIILAITLMQFSSIVFYIGISNIVVSILGFIGFYLLLKMKKLGLILVTIIGVIAIITGTILLSYLIIGFWIVIIILLLIKRNQFV